MEWSLFFLCDFYLFLRKSLPILRKKKKDSLVFSLSFTVAFLPTLDYQWFTAEWKAEKNDFIYLSSCERQSRKKKCHFTHNSLVLICKAGLKCRLFCGFYITHHLFHLAPLPSLTANLLGRCHSKSRISPLIAFSTHHNTYHSALSLVILA